MITKIFFVLNVGCMLANGYFAGTSQRPLGSAVVAVINFVAAMAMLSLWYKTA